MIHSLNCQNEAGSDRCSQDKCGSYENRQTRMSVQVDIPALASHSCG